MAHHQLQVPVERFALPVAQDVAQMRAERLAAAARVVALHPFLPLRDRLLALRQLQLQPPQAVQVRVDERPRLRPRLVFHPRCSQTVLPSSLRLGPGSDAAISCTSAIWRRVSRLPQNVVSLRGSMAEGELIPKQVRKTGRRCQVFSQTKLQRVRNISVISTLSDSALETSPTAI